VEQPTAGKRKKSKGEEKGHKSSCKRGFPPPEKAINGRAKGEKFLKQGLGGSPIPLKYRGGEGGGPWGKRAERSGAKKKGGKNFPGKGGGVRPVKTCFPAQKEEKKPWTGKKGHQGGGKGQKGKGTDAECFSAKRRGNPTPPLKEGELIKRGKGEQKKPSDEGREMARVLAKLRCNGLNTEKMSDFGREWGPQGNKGKERKRGRRGEGNGDLSGGRPFLLFP